MLNAFLSGAICMSYVTVALFFIRFWRTNRDRLFLFFAAAFLVLMTERAISEWMEVKTEWVPLGYSLRLGAFILVLLAVADKKTSGLSANGHSGSSGGRNARISRRRDSIVTAPLKRLIGIARRTILPFPRWSTAPNLCFRRLHASHIRTGCRMRTRSAIRSDANSLFYP